MLAAHDFLQEFVFFFFSVYPRRALAPGGADRLQYGPFDRDEVPSWGFDPFPR